MAVKFNPSSIGSGLGYATQINQLFSDVQSALQDAVSRTGNGPNAMSADLDLGTNDLLNVGTANISKLLVDGNDLAELISDAQDAATEAENWANRAENDLVPEGDGVDDYSALHWARKAEAFKDNAQDLTDEAKNWANLSYNSLVPEGDGVDDYSSKHFATVSSNWAEYGIGSPVPEGNGSEYSAHHWADKANQWAETAENTEVETGEYSALHWARKAEAFKDNAEAAAAGVSLPSVGSGDAYKMLRVKDDESGYELAYGAKYPAAASNFYEAGNRLYLADNLEEGIDLDFSAFSAAESVGPTGSGATNIWTSLDVLPLDTKSIVVSTELGATSSGAGFTSAALAIGRDGATVHTEVLWDAAGSGERQGLRAQGIVVPVDGNNVFLLWGPATNASSTTNLLKLEGYMV